MNRSVIALVLGMVVFAAFTILFVAPTPLVQAELAVSAGTCGGTSNAPANHCNAWPNTTLVDNCRCSGHTKASCGPAGSYYCEDNLKVKIKASSGTACEDHCVWTKTTTGGSSEAADPVVLE